MIKLSEAMGVPPPSFYEISKAMTALDTNKDAKLNFEELKPVLLQTLENLINQAKLAKQRDDEKAAT